MRRPLCISAIIAVAILLPLFPVGAAVCSCHGPDETAKTCLTMDSARLSGGQRVNANSICSRLPSVVGESLREWVCDATPLTENQAKPVAQGGVCTTGPLDAFSGGRASEPVGTSSGGDGPSAAKSTPVIPVLNVEIPDFVFSEDAGTTESSSLLAQYIAGAYRYLISIAAVAATIMFIYGAFLFLLGSALPKITQGKEIMVDAVVGLILVLASHLILRTINPETLSLQALYVKGVATIDLGNYNPAVRTPGAWPAAPEIAISKAEVARQVYEGAKMVQGVDPCTILAICELESGFRPVWNGYPKNPRENAGAFGPCQMRAANLHERNYWTGVLRQYFPTFPASANKPAVASWLLTDMRGAGFAAALMFRDLLGRSGGNELLAITNYAAGEGSTRGWRKAHSCSPAPGLTLRNGAAGGDLSRSCVPDTVAIPTLGAKPQGCPEDGYVCSNVKQNEASEYVGTCSDGRKCFAMKTNHYASYVIRARPRMAAKYDCTVTPGRGFTGSAAPAAAASRNTGTNRVARGDRVLLIGDSLAVGLNAPLSKIASDNGVAFGSVAQSGTVITQWAPRGQYHAQLQTALAQKPKFVFISLGTNDAYLSTTPAKNEADVRLSALLDFIRSSGATPLWIGPPSLPATYGGKSQNTVILPAIRSAVPSSDYFPSETLNLPRGDTLHPTDYTPWAQAFWEWL